MRDRRVVLPDPASLDSMSTEEAAEILAQLAHAHAVLAARFDARRQAARESMAPAPPDRLLTPVEVAERMGVPIRWLYRNASSLPFTRRLSRKMLRFSEAGLTRYLASPRVKP